MRYLFLDANIYIAANFNFKSTSFNKLLSYVTESKLRILITNIIYSELGSNIKERVVDAIDALHKFQRKHSVLAVDDSYRNLFETNIEYDKSVKSIRCKLDCFLTEAKAINIDIKSEFVNEVFVRYFSKTPPFSDKKKDEFPDAFNMLALRNWALDNSERVCVVSSDDDIKRFCDAEGSIFDLHSSLSEFIGLLNSEDEAKAEIYNSYTRLIESRKMDICDSIEIKFEGLEFYVNDIDSEVLAVEVDNVDLIDVQIIDCDKSRAEINVVAKISYEAEISLDDNPHMIKADYDLPVYSREVTLSATNVLESTITIKIDPATGLAYSIESIVNDNNPVIINANLRH